MTEKLKTPLRYPGGKSKFYPFIHSIMDKNGLIGGVYVEPFAGGAGIAFKLLKEKVVSEIYINDIDPAIYHFWLTVTKHTEQFLKLLNDTPVTIEEWHNQKYILEHPEEFDTITHGYSAFFLNRTNRSGILKGGIIGGKSQLGIYKLNSRFNKSNLMGRIENIGLHADKINVSGQDAVIFIKELDQRLPNNSLIYFDPPYYVKGQGLYRNSYKHNDHITIRDTLKTLKSKWVVSYDSCDAIRTIYLDFQQDEYTLSYSAQQKRQATEIIIQCPSLIRM